MHVWNVVVMQIVYAFQLLINREESNSGVARLVSSWGIVRPTDCIIRLFDC